MGKEPVIAIVIGSLLGLGVAFFAWKSSLNGADAPPAANQPTQENLVQNANDSSAFGSFAIVKPEDSSVYGDNPIEVSGISAPGNFIGIISEDTSDILLADSDGFTTEVELIGGVNVLSIWEFPDSGQPKNETRTVVYSTQLDEDTENTSDLEERLSEAGNNLTAMFGTITDISESTIQVRTDLGQIEQISTAQDTTSYANNIGEAEEIAFSDLAIGDYIVGLGSKNGNETLEAERILVLTQPETSSLVALKGTIKTLSAREFVVTNYDSTDYSIDATGSVNVTVMVDGEFDDVRLTQAAEEGDNIIVLGRMEEEEVVAERIHIVAAAQ